MLYTNLEECIKEVLNKVVGKTINSMENNIGGPFGAAVVQVIDNNYKLISVESNEVILLKDPTAHAEVQAIRKACKILDRRHLNDCILISTSKCCPMCLSAAIWARIPVIYYSLDYAIASSSGFKDNDIADYIKGNNKLIREIRVDNNNCNKLFEIWKDKEDKEVY